MDVYSLLVLSGKRQRDNQRGTDWSRAGVLKFKYSILEQGNACRQARLIATAFLKMALIEISRIQCARADMRAP